MKPNVVHLSSVHSSDDIRIYRKMCRTLADCGYRVTLIAPCVVDHTMGGVRIRALPLPTSRWTRFAHLFRVYRAASREGGDLYHFHDPELIPIGILLKLSGHRVICDVHEDLPKQVLTKRWIPQQLRRFVSVGAWLTESAGAAFWDGIVAATPSIAKKFHNNKTVIVQNFPLRSEIASAAPRPFAERPANFLYAGAITAERGIRELIAAMSQLPESLTSKLVLAGNVRPPALADELSTAEGWERVDFRGWCERDHVRKLMSNVQAGIVTFLPSPNHVEAQPNKLFEYMSAGLPVIASDFPLWRRIVDKTGCGILVDPQRPAAIRDAMEWLLTHPREATEMGNCGRRAVEEMYNWDSAAVTLLALYRNLLPDNPAWPASKGDIPQTGVALQHHQAA